MREIKGHAVTGVSADFNHKLKVEVYDEPDTERKMHSKYQVYYKAAGQWERGQLIQFHKTKPYTPVVGEVPPEVVPNGVTNEVLLAVVLDRLRLLQNTLPCRENALAITALEESLHWLKDRTVDRIERGVSGSTNK